MPRLVQVATLPSLVARRAFGARAIAWGRAGPLRLVEGESCGRPEGSGWQPLAMRLAGICGSDIAALTGRSPTVMWPLVSFPSVPGHEILATLAEPSAAEAGARQGQTPARVRVVVDPFLSCEARGLPSCPECESGQSALCRRSAGPGRGIERGMMIGFHNDLPGGWGTRLWAHQSQLHAVPQGLSDTAALLVEPVSVAAHAILQVPWEGSESVLVVGGGTIGLATVAALRLFGGPAPRIAVRHAAQQKAAADLGADPVAGDGAAWPRLGGAAAVSGWAGRPLWLGGFDVVIDAVGTARTFAYAAQAVRSGGTVIRVGDVGTLPRAPAADVWAPDVRVFSPFGYGRERLWNGTVGHTFDLVLERIGALDDVLSSLVTHTYALRDYRAALATATDHRGRHSIKVAFRGDG